MKVYKNLLTPYCYGGGMLLVAANSPEEANEVCLKSDELENLYWEYGEIDDDGYWECSDIRSHTSSCYYEADAFEEIPGLEWNGEACVIAEKSYYE